VYIKSAVNISYYLHLFLRTEPRVQRLRGFNRCAKLCTNIRGQLKVGLFPTRKQPDAANNLYMSVVPVGLGGLRVRCAHSRLFSCLRPAGGPTFGNSAAFRSSAWNLYRVKATHCNYMGGGVCVVVVNHN